MTVKIQRRPQSHLGAGPEQTWVLPGLAATREINLTKVLGVIRPGGFDPHFTELIKGRWQNRDGLLLMHV